MLRGLDVHFFLIHLFHGCVLGKETDAQCSASHVPHDGLDSVARGVTDGVIELCKIMILETQLVGSLGPHFP